MKEVSQEARINRAFRSINYSLMGQVLFSSLYFSSYFLKSNLPESMEAMDKLFYSPRTVGSLFVFLAINTYIYVQRCRKEIRKLKISDSN